MRAPLCLCATLVMLATAVAAQQAPAKPGAPSPAPSRVGTMSDLMVHLIYPTSDAVFYISSRTPATDEEWKALEAKTLTLAESGNLLMMPGRTRPGRWNADARQMLDAAAGAFKAAKARSAEGVEAVSDQLYESCVSCHKTYRKDYGKARPQPLEEPAEISNAQFTIPNIWR